MIPSICDRCIRKCKIPQVVSCERYKMGAVTAPTEKPRELYKDSSIEIEMKRTERRKRVIGKTSTEMKAEQAVLDNGWIVESIEDINPKITEGKIDPTKVSPDFVLGIADIRGHGDAKYGIDSWKRVPREQWIAAAHRHLLKLENGEKMNDADWGHHHALHIACCMMFVNHIDSADGHD